MSRDLSSTATQDIALEALSSRDHANCRICGLDSPQPLEKMPCQCKGTIGRVHRVCLDTWRQYAIQHARRIYFLRGQRPNGSELCELCGTPYQPWPEKSSTTPPTQCRIFHKIPSAAWCILAMILLCVVPIILFWVFRT